MAYQSFTPVDLDQGLITQHHSVSADAVEASRFSALELRVIDLAERFDVIREPSPKSFLRRVMAVLFGVRGNRPLANPRLEALRRFASLTRHHADRLGGGDIEAFVGAGFTIGQAHGLITYFAARRPRGRAAGLA